MGSIHLRLRCLNRLTNVTEADHTDGTLGAAGSFGPYLQKPPVNPFISGTDAGGNPLGAVVAGGANALPAYAVDTGWVYNRATGEIRACMDDAAVAADLGMAAEDVQTPAAP